MWCYVDMVFCSRLIFSITGAGCDVPESPSRRITFANADVDWETMLIPPDCECVPTAGVFVGSPDAVVAGAPDSDRETISTPPDCERVPGTGNDAGDPIFESFNE